MFKVHEKMVEIKMKPLKNLILSTVEYHVGNMSTLKH